MEPTAEQIMREVQAISDNVTALHADKLTAEDLSHAVAAGLKQAISDPQFWDSAVYAMQGRAKEQAGGWLLGGLRAMLSKLAWIAVIGLSVYLLGGWQAVVAVFKAHQT